MRGTDAYADLRRMGSPVLTTRDAADRLGLSVPSANHLLARLVSAGLAVRLRHGLWSLEESVDPMTLPEHVTFPHPSYVSLHSALWHRGLVEQVPSVIYLVSLGRPRRVSTRVATFSVHRVPPEIFGGFDVVGPGGVHLATPEKALFDTFYLANAKSRLFADLPELDLSPPFDAARMRSWIAQIRDSRRRAWVGARFDRVLRGGPPRRVDRVHAGP